MLLVRIILFIIILSVIAAFAALNAQIIEVNYFFGTQSMPLAACLAAAVVMGMLIGLVFCAKQLVLLWTRLYSLGRKLKSQ